MAGKHICVAIYLTSDQADEAFSRLRVEQFSMDLLSFMGRDYWHQMLGSRNAGERFIYRGKQGPFWKRLWSLMPGWGVFWFFPDGPVLVAGPMVRSIIATQEQRSDEAQATGFQSGLSGIGIPEASLVQYEQALMGDKILVFVQGTLEEIQRAQSVLNETKAINHTVHHLVTE